MLALLPIITALAGGQSLGTVLAGLTLPEWIEIAAVLLKAEPDVAKAFVAIHPALTVFEGAIAKKLDAEKAGALAIRSFQDWAAANPGAAYYTPDGGVAAA